MITLSASKVENGSYFISSAGTSNDVKSNDDRDQLSNREIRGYFTTLAGMTEIDYQGYNHFWRSANDLSEKKLDII